jgi:hypothetical protein
MIYLLLGLLIVLTCATCFAIGLMRGAADALDYIGVTFLLDKRRQR